MISAQLSYKDRQHSHEVSAKRKVTANQSTCSASGDILGIFKLYTSITRLTLLSAGK